MTRHEISPDVRNSTVEYCINEYVRDEKHREILRDHWFRSLSFEALAEKYELSVYTIRQVIYGVGDPILIRAHDIDCREEGRGIYGTRYVLKEVLAVP